MGKNKPVTKAVAISQRVADIFPLDDAQGPTHLAGMDRCLPHLTPLDCDMALRLAANLAKAGFMEEAEAADWKARLLAWKVAHTTEPTEA